MVKYLVRAYVPAFCTGFELDAVHGVNYEDITKLDFLLREGTTLTVEQDHGDELFIMRTFPDGKRYVAGFALPENSTERAPDGGLLRDNWRYRKHIS